MLLVISFLILLVLPLLLSILIHIAAPVPTTNIIIHVLRTSRRAIGAPVLGSWFLGFGIIGIGGLVAWLLVGCFFVGWLVGCWLLVVCLLSLGGLLKRSSERVLVASLVFVDGGSERVLVASLFWLRRGGWELVVGSCGLVGGLEAWWPSLWSQNLEKPLLFEGFREAMGNREHTPPLFGLPASDPMCF